MRAEMDAQGPAAALGQHVEIAPRLRRLDDAEGEFAAGYRQVSGIVAGDLQEHPGIGAALVGLTGRMQEPRAEAEAGRDALAVADQSPHGLERIAVLPVAFDVSEQRAIIAVANPAEMRRAGSRPASPRFPTALRFFSSAKTRDAGLFENGVSRRQRAGPLIGGGEFARLVLARLDVRLIEWVDAEDRSRNRRRDLPAEEFLAEVVAVGDLDAHHRMAGVLEFNESRVRCRRRCSSASRSVDEQTIVAIDAGGSERLAVDRDQSLAVLAGRFRQQLLEPRAEIRNAGRSHDRDLVAARLPEHAQHGAERRRLDCRPAAHWRRRSAP